MYVQVNIYTDTMCLGISEAMTTMSSKFSSF
jgi:hypothetical protein